MRIGNAIIAGKEEVIIEEKNGILDLHALLDSTDNKQNLHFNDVVNSPELVELIGDRLDKYKGDFRQIEDSVSEFLPAIGYPEKILCIGLNYYGHVMETKRDVPEYPVIFSKFNNSLAAHNSVVEVPAVTSKLDYEGELGIIIGKKAANVSREDALDHVFGYFVANDLSARDLQYRTHQWLLGKTLDRFYPNGPFIVTSDEIKDPNNLELTTRMNGEVRQHINTSKMMFKCDELISYISEHMTLKPGDVISTGTPEGVIRGMPPEKQVWIKKGDTVDVEIEGIGKLSTVFA